MLQEVDVKKLCSRILSRLFQAAEHGRKNYYTSDLWMVAEGDDPAMGRYEACRILQLLRRHGFVDLSGVDHIRVTWKGRMEILKL